MMKHAPQHLDTFGTAPRLLTASPPPSRNRCGAPRPVVVVISLLCDGGVSAGVRLEHNAIHTLLWLLCNVFFLAV